ncbi:MAG: alcohol dehydrogenase catalytic domain-containing protein [Novosphingobium sp.]
MKALLFKPGMEYPEIDDIDIDLPRDHEVLVRVVACGVCHSDLHFMESRNQTAGVGLYGRKLDSRMQPGPAERRDEEAQAPMIVMGHEPAGIVEAVGSQVRHLKVGDRVVGAGISHCGTCRQCLAGRPYLCLYQPRRGPTDKPRLSKCGERVSQFANLGGFAEMILAHETSLVKIDVDIPFASASILGCSVATGTGAALNTAKVEPGSTVAVFGCGGIGLSVIQGARIAGAARIFAIDIVDLKLEMALGFGATDTLNSRDMDAAAALLDATDGHGIDFSFETTARSDVAQVAYDCLGLRGKLTCLAATPSNLSSMVWSERQVIGSMIGSSRLAIDMPRYLEFYRQGRLKLDEMISLVVPPQNFNEAAKAVNDGLAARTVISFGE